MIQKARKWSEIAAQDCVHTASRKKDAKLYIAKGNLIGDNNNGSSQDGLQYILFCSLPFTLVEKQP